MPTNPTYAVAIDVRGFNYTLAAWRIRDSGRPTDDNLAKYVAEFEESCKPGGCNDHLGIQVVRSAAVKRQSTGEIVATYVQPMFSVV